MRHPSINETCTVVDLALTMHNTMVSKSHNVTLTDAINVAINQQVCSLQSGGCRVLSRCPSGKVDARNNGDDVLRTFSTNTTAN